MPNIQTYQQFQQMIRGCQSGLATDTRSSIHKTVQAIEAFFRDQILLYSPDDDPHHSINVEINKQLRLLKTDCLFLRSAKQTHVVEQRLQQIGDRLTLLERYCAMILGNAD
jgi:hypothetical protein